jgi:dihydroxyacetone kinase-like protein
MKKLINAPEDVVVDALQGIEAAHPELSVDHAHKVIYRADAPHTGKVGIISGGGSGHEPLHGGFVGLGMLDAACAGEVFTSPVPDQMLAATKLVDGGRRPARREELHRRRHELRDGRRARSC